MIAIDIILIDDEKEYCATMKNESRYYGMRVTDFQNWEEGIREFLSDVRYKALILDAKCLIHQDDEKEDMNFLPYVLDKLREIEVNTNRHIPFVVSTGYFDNLVMFEKTLQERKAKIFSKTAPKKEMFEYLKSQIERSGEIQIEKEYADIFELFEKGHLDATFRSELMTLLKEMQTEDERKIADNFAAIRRIKETLMRVVKEKKPDFKQPKMVYEFSNLIKNVSSTYGSHGDKKLDYKSGKYAIISLTNALLEMLLWFKNEII